MQPTRPGAYNTVMLTTLFAATLFLAAGLLFAAQPMAGKALLPLAGGAPAVWTTCLVFFQSALLLGYLYADRSTALSVRRQVGWHVAALVLGLLAYIQPWVRPDPEWVTAGDESPVFGLALYLAVFIGPPFVALSASAPVFQGWFAATGHHAGRDPYFLYAASNAGSFAGLLAYPFLVEPWLSLPEQATVWCWGYVVVFGLAATCGAVVWVRAPHPAGLTQGTDETQPPKQPADAGRSPALVWWALLAALPSSLLMSVTAHLTTDVAPVPLLWVVPLALYLLTFVVAFGWWPARARAVVGRVTPMLLVFAAVALLTRATEPPGVVAVVHLAAFTAAALLCHGELAAARPDRRHLSRFYLAVATGGVLGGLFNAVIAPVVFARVGPAEYPLGLVLVALVRPRVGSGGAGEWRIGAGKRGDRPLWMPSLFHSSTPLLFFAAFTLALVIGVPAAYPSRPGDDSAGEFLGRVVRSGLMYGVPAVVAFALVRRPARFALCLAVLFLAGRLDTGLLGDNLLTARNFFGTLRVTRVAVPAADGSPRALTRLVHGTTLHGQQWANEAGPPRPLMYYHRTGPAGRLLARLPAGRTRRVAAVGLGCGALAAYSRPGETWGFYELDPAVVRIAADPAYFTFLRDAQGSVEVVSGDARRQLAREPDGSFDLIVLDAFSSDAIPVHLLTREAVGVYTRKLAAGGILLFHLSNRYLDLPPLVARTGAAAEPPLRCRIGSDSPTPAEKADGKFPSVWAVLYRAETDLGDAAADPFWPAARPHPGPVWRDDFSNLLAVWKRDEE